MKAAITPRLYFDGTTGLLRAGPLLLTLDEAPPVPVPHVRAIDYWPNRGAVRVSGQGWREMTRDECATVKQWLDRQEANATASLGVAA